LLWLANLTGAHIGLAPISQDPEDRCSIWENLVSLVDFQCPGFPLTAEELCHYIDIPPSPASSAALPLSPPLPGDTDYKNNAHLKPPYSYATLICMAMEASEEPKLTLAAICKWISDNFCYFRRAHPTWQSSIRHNLCINKRFVKVPREKGEPGRGAFWKLHPQYAEWLRSGTPKGRGTPPERVPLPPQPGALPLHPARPRGQHLGWPQEPLLPKPSPTKPGSDETLMATAFLEAAWPEESGGSLPSCVPAQQGAANTPAALPAGQGMDWDPLAHLNLY
ncbi:PREDICTED: forkhead box protein J1-like, partial [Ficedula albicollis]|uniref:forkhead box protein J1-like n=1 Tax=Ficedula albicollis TaxID=59894 RepID=UPI00035A20A7